MSILVLIVICFFIFSITLKNSSSIGVQRAFHVNKTQSNGLSNQPTDYSGSINNRILENTDKVGEIVLESAIKEGLADIAGLPSQISLPKFLSNIFRTFGNFRTARWKKIHNSDLAPLTKSEVSFRRREHIIKFPNIISDTTKHAKYAVSMILQLSGNFNLGIGLTHALTFYHTLRKFDRDEIDLVLWISDSEGSPAAEIVGEQIWRYFEKLPGFFFKGGNLCSEFGLKASDINVFHKGHRAKHILIAQMKKTKTITLDMYERVVQIDWDMLPIKPLLKMIQQDMHGAKVMTQTDNEGPLLGACMLLQPDFHDYRYICEHILNGVGWHDSLNGWNDYGKVLSPYCPGSSVKWGVCDPPRSIDWSFHGGTSDQGLFFYYYGLIHDWLLTIDPGQGPKHYYRKFGSKVFEGGLWNGTGIVEMMHFKGTNKLRHMYSSYIWRENMFEAYHNLDMSQIKIFEEVYETMLNYEHEKPNTWEY